MSTFFCLCVRIRNLNTYLLLSLTKELQLFPNTAERMQTSYILFFRSWSFQLSPSRILILSWNWDAGLFSHFFPKTAAGVLVRKRTDVGVSRPGSLLVFQFIPRALDEIEVRALFQTSSCSSTLNWTISSFVHRFTVSLIEMKGFPKLPPKWRHTVAAVLWPVYLMSQNIACCWIDQTYPKELGLQVMKLQAWGICFHSLSEKSPYTGLWWLWKRDHLTAGFSSIAKLLLISIGFGPLHTLSLS